MKRLVIFALYIFATLSASENEFKIYGSISDAHSKAPLTGVNIFFEGISKGSASDQDGLFSLPATDIKGTRTLIASYIGYHDYFIEIEFPLTADKRIDIPLKESAIQMDQIVVTGTRSERMLKHSPVTTQVIKGKTIQESGAIDLAEVLERVTGVNVASNELGTGTSTVELQGFGSEHVLILVDGVKMIGRIRGDLDISQIPSSQIERIEIVKGATSTLYGSEAMGGVINIVTKKAGDDFKINAATQAGSYGKINSNMSLAANLAGWHPILSLNYRRSSGFDLDKKTDRMDGTAFDKYQIGLKLSKKINEQNSFSTQLNYFDEKQSVISSPIFEDLISNDNFASRTEFKTSSLNPLGLTAGIEFSGYNHTLNQKVRSSGFIRDGSLTSENLFKSDILFSFDMDNDGLSQKINGGYAYETESIESDRLVENNKRNSLHNFFLQDEIKFSQFLTVVLGSRLDAHSAYGNQTSPKISVMLSPSHNVRFRGSYGHGFRAPSFKELYLQYFNESVLYRVDGNPDLKPEKSKSLNLGTEFWTDNNYHTRISVFYNSIANLIDYQLIGSLDTLSYRSENLSAAETWGAEWDMQYYPFTWLDAGLGYYYLDSQTKYVSPTTEKVRAPLQLKPKHRANVRIGIQPFNDIKIIATLQVLSKKFFFDPDRADFKKNWIEGYMLAHINLGFPIYEHVSGQLGVKNLTDYINMEWGPMPGREFYLTLRINY